MNNLFRVSFWIWVLFSTMLILNSFETLGFLLAKTEIQKMRADKIEKFLETKYTGEYSAKP